MTNCAYSVLYSVKDDGDTWAVDWDWTVKEQWGRSCKEYGLGHRWEFMEGFNEEAYKALLSHFKLKGKEEQFPLEKIVNISPANLAKLSNTNPKSNTLGDKRKALEVL